jgi:hypothetical protein
MADDVNTISCAQCFEEFEDVKNAIKCVACNKMYHSKCVSVDLRGFRKKQGTWRCKMCVCGENANKSEVMNERSFHILLNKITELTSATMEIKSLLQTVLAENKKLSEEVALLKNVQTISGNDNLTYANVTKTNVFMINPKEEVKGVNNNGNQVRKEIGNKINPVQLGVGLSMEKTTKKGAVLLNCTTEKNIDEVRNAIQANVGHGYEATEPKSFKGRIKLYFIHEDEVLVQKNINQNEVNPNNVEIKILYKSKVVNKKFNMVLEVNNYVLNSLIKMDKINIGWNCCRFEQDYGVVRCFNCRKYGHIASKCTSQCPICGENHNQNKCNSTLKMCNNCSQANKKLKTNLDTNHQVWSKDCTVLSSCSLEIADHVLVFYLRGLFKKWQQPIYFAFSSSATKSSVLVDLIKFLVQDIQNCGLKILVTICDQGQPNQLAIHFLLKESKKKGQLCSKTKKLFRYTTHLILSK